MTDSLDLLWRERSAREAGVGWCQDEAPWCEQGADLRGPEREGRLVERSELLEPSGYQRLVAGQGDDRLEVTMPDRTTATIDRHTAIGHALDFGTLFCALAGLMNVAVALDAGRRTVDRRGGER